MSKTITTVTEFEEGVLVKQTVTETVEETGAEDPFVIEFFYHGYLRVVANPKFVQGAYEPRTGFNVLLAGTEITKGDCPTGTHKHYSLSDIRYP